MNDQSLSLIRSLLKLVGAALLAHGLTNAASFVNTEATIGLVTSIVGLVLSYKAHKPDPAPVTPPDQKPPTP